MVTFQIGNKKRKFKSLKAAWEAAKVSQPELKYITFYMRQRKAEKDGGLGWKPVDAMKKLVRKYERKAA